MTRAAIGAPTCVAFTAKDPVVAPAATETAAGRVSALSPERVTEVPPDGAGCDRVTVHCALPGVTTSEGVQVSPVRESAVVSAMAALCEAP